MITCFPPGPEKYPHIGHAKSMILNYELAQKYKGKFILRFEDTNPDTVQKEFYKVMQEDFKWLGVKWDKLIYASDYMDKYYKYAEKAIKHTMMTKGKAVIINVASVAAGFLILLFAQILPIRNFGLLIAISMVGSGLGALTLLPVILILANRNRKITAK